MHIENNPPLTEATFFLLLGLAPDEKHRYAIMQDVESLSAGALYGVLKRLLEVAWVKRVDDDEQDNTGRAHKADRLTTLDRRVLAAEVVRLQTLPNTARSLAVGKTR